MKLNVGNTDRIVRFLIAAAAVIMVSTGMVRGPWAIAASIVAAVMVLTGSIGFCGLYTIFGISTCRRKAPLRQSA